MLDMVFPATILRAINGSRPPTSTDVSGGQLAHFSNLQYAMRRTSLGKYVLYIGVAVMLLILTTAGFFYLKARSAFLKANTKVQEEILRDDLMQIRAGIRRYSLEKDAPPQSLFELVTSGYLPNIPTDPVTDKRDWQVEIGDYETRSGKQRGVVNVHSSSNQKSSLGTPYTQW